MVKKLFNISLSFMVVLAIFGAAQAVLFPQSSVYAYPVVEPDSTRQYLPMLFSKSEYQLVWSDEFSEAGGSVPDPKKWNYVTGPGSVYGNQELEYYTDRPENAYQQDGKLWISARKESLNGKEYTSARITTRNKGDWKYGYFEVRAQLPEGQGFWPTIWILPTDNVYGKWPYSGEVDIMEALGQQPDTIYGTAHWANSAGQDQADGDPFVAGSQALFTQGFHVFGLAWEPGVLRWYVDGKRYHTLEKEMPFDQKFHLVLNLAVGGKWPGNPDKTTVFPQALVIDYVRIYQ